MLKKISYNGGIIMLNMGCVRCQMVIDVVNSTTKKLVFKTTDSVIGDAMKVIRKYSPLNNNN